MLLVPQDGGQFHPGYVLLDPYSTRAAPVLLSDAYYNTAPHLPPYLDMAKPVMMGLLSGLTEDLFDWQGAHRPIRAPEPAAGGSPRPLCLEDAVLCDMDIASFTQVWCLGLSLTQKNCGDYARSLHPLLLHPPSLGCVHPCGSPWPLCGRPGPAALPSGGGRDGGDAQHGVPERCARLRASPSHVPVLTGPSPVQRGAHPGCAGAETGGVRGSHWCRKLDKPCSQTLRCPMHLPRALHSHPVWGY